MRGFTLIELMIVLAIIGILSAFALPIYQRHIAKTQLARVVYELSSTKNSIDSILNEGGFPTLNPAEQGRNYSGGSTYKYIQFNGSNPASNLISSASITNNGNRFRGIEATIGKDSSNVLHGSIIRLLRDANDGTWQCQIVLATQTSIADINVDTCSFVNS